MKPLCLWIWGSLYSLHLVSLDVLGVTVCWMLLFALTVTGEFPDPHQVAIIASGVWVAYTSDRLLDGAWLYVNQPHSMRHRVHQQYRTSLMAVTTVVVLLMAPLVMILCSRKEILAGALLITLIGVYFYFTQLRRAGRFRFEKELCVGFLLALGVAMPSVLDADDLSLAISSFSLVGALFSLNCYVVSTLETHLDQAQEAIQNTGKSGHGFRVWLSFFVYLFLLGLGSLLEYIPVPLAMASILGALCLMALILLKPKLQRNRPNRDLIDRTVYSFVADLSLSLSAFSVLVWL